MSGAPKRGVTVEAHVTQLLDNVSAQVAVMRTLLTFAEIPPSDRQVMSQRLAGAIGNLEIVRQWLAAGAPR